MLSEFYYGKVFLNDPFSYTFHFPISNECLPSSISLLTPLLKEFNCFQIISNAPFEWQPRQPRCHKHFS